MSSRLHDPSSIEQATGLIAATDMNGPARGPSEWYLVVGL